MEQKQSNESLVRERDFYRSKFEGMEKKIKSLTTDCAYLKKDNDGLRDRLKENNFTISIENILNSMLQTLDEFKSEDIKYYEKQISRIMNYLKKLEKQN